MVKEKQSIRNQLLEQLLSLTLREVERRSKHVEQKIQRLSEYIRAQYVMAYYPLKGEVNLLGMLRKDLKRKIICFPVIQGNKLKAYQVEDIDSDLVSGPLGVRQPDTARCQEVPLAELDLVIVPGIAFDKYRNRLGRGGGYYDRFLKELPDKAKTVGVAFDLQIIEDLPHTTAHDVKVDMLLTENDSF
ncbi:MAG: 5-formyltetrahydrofolate cyclo-ligase [Candidatus Omnitrophica bacterium]|nr:5-formyltetrahydrofolate cyclo-ligase [Candidatus Omnitrophota bacterium]